MRSHGLAKRYGHRWVLRGIGFALLPGERVLLTGPNGAGKSTLLAILAGVLRPTAGEVWVAGQSLWQGGAAVRAHIGYLPHQSLLYPELTAEENLQFYGRLYGVPSLEERLGDLLDRFRLRPYARERAGTLSFGTLRRLALARALLHNPDLVLLDEPLAGLDRESRQSFLSWLEGSGEESRRPACILTSHEPERLAGHVDRVLRLEGGELS